MPFGGGIASVNCRQLVSIRVHQRTEILPLTVHFAVACRATGVQYSQGPLGLSKRKKLLILTVTDFFLRWFVAVLNHSSALAFSVILA